MYPYCAIFHAGAVVPSCSRLLQLLTGPGDGEPAVGLFAGLRRPEGVVSPVLCGSSTGRAPWNDEQLLLMEAPRPRRPVGDAYPDACGLKPPPPARFLGPMGSGKRLGSASWAALLNAPRHCMTCAGSFCSYRSTVRNMSCWCRLNGGAWQARRKCEMFSIWTKGMADCLNLMPGGGAPRLMSLRSTGQGVSNRCNVVMI